MNGVYKNTNPINETFLLGDRFPDRESLAVILDSSCSQEYFEISNALFAEDSYLYDICIFSSDNNRPVLVPPCALYYTNYLEYYTGDVAAVTLKAAIDAHNCGCIFKKKIWHISDLSAFNYVDEFIPGLFSFFDEIWFVNEQTKAIFFSAHKSLDISKTKVGQMDKMLRSIK